MSRKLIDEMKENLKSGVIVNYPRCGGKTTAMNELRAEKRAEINRERRERYKNDPEYRERRKKEGRERLRKKWANMTKEERRARTIKNQPFVSKYITNRYRNDPEFREKMKASNRKYKRKRYREDPEFRAKQRLSLDSIQKKKYYELTEAEKEKKRAYMREWRAKNKDKVRGYNKKSYKKAKKHE